ncbi:SLAC1 anion channel family protein [Salipiger sp. P9]|uniref:SLAC1 anion channel family protein n=1 Tax=Salipiger pentaromativorans TaxID=2943193 RepID=UPI00215825A6|nr:SLAC1 anion channel family protein [Salipiger pentaromativorans]MCR8549391.1 SLAC1 anion channel family protein [Salipiger pentaromativorans]
MSDVTPQASGAAAQAAAVPHSRLAHFPVTFFASVMGLAGLALALHRAELSFGWAHWASHAALWAAVADFLMIAVFFALKALREPKAFMGEWHHPVKLAFFPAISISILLIATAMRPVSADAARVVWVVGMLLQGTLTLAVLSGWIGHRPFQHIHISPAWFIPAVGNIVVPVAGVSLGFPETSWLFFSAGLVFWIVLLTLVMNRLIFHDPLPGRLVPTLVILIAPPAVAFLSWLQLNGGVLDGFARVLYYTTLVFLGLVLTQAPGILKLPFAMSWWALSFPVAALTISTLRYAELAQLPALVAAGGVFLAVLLVIVAYLILRTGLAILRGEICQPE